MSFCERFDAVPLPSALNPDLKPQPFGIQLTLQALDAAHSRGNYVKAAQIIEHLYARLDSAAGSTER